MANLEKFHENPQKQLLEELQDAMCVMLGSTDEDEHMQPMTPQIDPDESVIYFYSDRFSELGKTIAVNPGTVHLCHISKDYQACVKGRLTAHHDKSTIDKFWDQKVAAWYPEGKEDKKLMMLKFVPHDAAIWASDANPLTFMYEMAKANIKHEEPELGEMKTVDL